MLSIIIKVFNEEKYLKNCVLSFIDEVNQDDEIIFIDDGSVDNSRVVIEDLILMYPGLKLYYYYQENMGPGAAVNLGIKKSRKDYIQIIDGDDELSTGTITKIKQQLKKNAVDMLLFNIKTIYRNGNESTTNHRFDSYIVCKDISVTEMLGITPSLTNKVLSRRLVNENNMQLLNVYMGEDLNFSSKVYLKLDSYIYCDDIYYKYIEREGSLITSQESLKRNLNLIEVSKDIVNYYVQENCVDNYSKELFVLLYEHLFIYSVVRIVKTSKTNTKEGTLLIKEIFKTYTTLIKGLSLEKTERIKVYFSNPKGIVLLTILMTKQYWTLFILI